MNDFLLVISLIIIGSSLSLVICLIVGALKEPPNES